MPIQNNSKKLCTINDIIRFLAYNSELTGIGSPDRRDKDFKICESLAECIYPWTEKQAGLALKIAVKYKSLIHKIGIDVTDVIDNPTYEKPFRIINFEQSIEKIIDEDGEEFLQIRFPYNEKLITLIRCLKEKTQGLIPMRFNGEDKVWTLPYCGIAVYYTTLIAVRYNFRIYCKEILDEFDAIRQEKKNHKPTVVEIKESSIRLINPSDTLREYWEKHIQQLPLLQQIDQLKIFELPCINSINTNSLAEKIAFSQHRDMFISRKEHNKQALLTALQKLDCFPALCCMYGDLNTVEDMENIKEWFEAFDSIGITEDQLCFGLEKELVSEKLEDNALTLTDNRKTTAEPPSTEVKDTFSKFIKLNNNNRTCNKNTKILFVRNRIPRSLTKSTVKIKSAFMMQDGAFWPVGSNTLSIFVDNLDKRLYYIDNCPENFKGTKILNELVQTNNKR